MIYIPCGLIKFELYSPPPNICPPAEKLCILLIITDFRKVNFKLSGVRQSSPVGSILILCQIKRTVGEKKNWRRNFKTLSQHC